MEPEPQFLPVRSHRDPYEEEGKVLGWFSLAIDLIYFPQTECKETVLGMQMCRAARLGWVGGGSAGSWQHLAHMEGRMADGAAQKQLGVMVREHK